MHKPLTNSLKRLWCDTDGNDQKKRAAVLAKIKEVFKEDRAIIQEKFETQKLGAHKTVRAHSDVMDRVICALFDLITQEIHPLPEKDKKADIPALLAVGGYGRREMAPFSDVDLLFLVPDGVTPEQEEQVTCLLYFLWDMGLKVGQAIRNTADCIAKAKEDMTIRTNMLEARFLWGDEDLYGRFQKAYRKYISSGSGLDFLEDKRQERDARHERAGDSRYMLEPQIKEGRGGLRDMHILFWLAKYLFDIIDMKELVDRGLLTDEDVASFIKAHQFLITVRCHLHYMTGREEDHLTFDLQPELAKRMGYTERKATSAVERFMKHYFYMVKTVGDLTRIVFAVIEEQHRRRPFRLLGLPGKEIDGFSVSNGRLGVADPAIFDEDPLMIIRMFRLAQEYKLGFQPRSLKAVTEKLPLVAKLRRNKEANQLFLEILTHEKSPERVLRRMNESGVLGRFVPDFGRVVAQMQYDMYHVYTTDEHTIHALGILSDLATKEIKDPALLPLSEMLQSLSSKRILPVAVFLHDIAKGRGGDHAEEGAVIARKLCPRFGLDAAETELVAWLVRQHLLMSRTAFKRDVTDAKTVEDFVQHIQSPERLKLLYILTCIDIKAVGPNIWNAWKANLLKELYFRGIDRLSGGFLSDEHDRRLQGAKDAIIEAFVLADKTVEQAAAYIDLCNAPHLISTPMDQHIRYAAMIEETEKTGEKVAISFIEMPEQDVTELVVYAQDHPGIFSQIAGAIAGVGASIVDAKIVTLRSGMVLDRFSIQESDLGKNAIPEKKAVSGNMQHEKLRTHILDVLTGKQDVAKRLAERHRVSPLQGRAKVFTVPQRVNIDLNASKTHTVIEVNGPDRPGFLYDVTHALTAQHLQISSAHISTYGERAVDVFYVKDIFGMKIDNPDKLKQIREALLSALAL